MKTLLVSHGLFAAGLLDSFEMICGKNDSISVISLSDDGVKDFSNRLNNYLEENKDNQVLILCDIKGGTPYNEAYRRYLDNLGRIRVIAGMNLPMLIEVGMLISIGTSLDEAYATGLSIGRQSVNGVLDEINEENEIEF